MIRWANLIATETLEAYNQRVTQLATELKVTRGRKLRTDGTVVESNIHAPSDSRLLADSVRVIGRTLQRTRQVLSKQTDLGAQVFRNRTRSAKKVARQVQRLVARQGKLENRRTANWFRSPNRVLPKPKRCWQR